MYNAPEKKENSYMKRVLPFLLLLLSLAAHAKDVPTTVQWPNDSNPIVRFTFGKFMKAGSVGSMSSYTVDVTAENLWSKEIPNSAFEAYFFSKENVRVGNGYISLNNLGAGEKVRFTVQFSATGAQPATLKIVATMLPKELGPEAPQKKIRLTVYSIPSGAKLKVDGVEAGQTPKQVEFALGKHALEFSREGYHVGTFPVEFGPDDVSGGTVSYELGALSHDTVEMRDGSTLLADIESMNDSAVVVRVGGLLQSLDRNQVKRILLVPREVVNQNQQDKVPNAAQK
jgi:hypothetical protein